MNYMLNKQHNNDFARLISQLLALFTILLLPTTLLAEPYLAVRTGQKCLACHVNPTGGGKRTPYGDVYGKQSLAKQQLMDPNKVWDGKVNDFLALGADLRYNLESTSTPNENTSTEFKLEEASLYLDINLIPDYLKLYIDEKVAPGGAVNMEAWAQLKTRDNLLYLKAGRFYLPYGIRLQDDGAFIRQVTGINFNNSDNGIEFGFEPASWSATLAFSNGTSGGGENNQQKQYSLRAEYIAPSWRLGSSYNFNDGENDNNRELAGIFAGAHFFGIDWLFEYDHVNNESALSGREQDIYYLEANLGYFRGHNLKLSYENYDPDNDVAEDEQTRTSFIWEYNPFEFTQVRTGVRLYDGIPQNNQQNREQYFIQLHNYF